MQDVHLVRPLINPSPLALGGLDRGGGGGGQLEECIYGGKLKFRFGGFFVKIMPVSTIMPEST